MLHKLMKSIGMHPIDVEIEPGTVIHFWVNNNKEKNNKNKDGRKKKKPSLVLIQGFAGNSKNMFLVLTPCIPSYLY